MLKKIAFAGVGTLLLVSPLAASADVLSDLQAQIQALLARIAVLQAQLQSSAPQNTSGQQSTPSASGVLCPVLSRTLYLGIRGQDVSELQRFLIAQGLLSADSATGYYGTLTRRAIQAWQSNLGVASSGDDDSTGWGVVGPRTRATMLARCGSATVNDTTMACSAIEVRSFCPAGQHYESRRDSNGCGVLGPCVPDSPVSFSASPTSGAAPLTVTFSAYRTNGVSTFTTDFGDGTAATMGSSTGCGSASDTSMTTCIATTHTYTSAGTYTATLIKPGGCSSGAAAQGCLGPPDEILGTATITVRGSVAGGAPSISGIDGPASLNVGQQGTWAVRASVPNVPGASLNYSVWWGDEAQGLFSSASNAARSDIQTSATFMHAYSSAGTYRPTFTVSNSVGSAQTSASVVVGDSANTSTFSASPTSGTAPLAVDFKASVPESGQYTLGFGDGTTQKLSFSEGTCSDGSNFGMCGLRLDSLRHTYTSPGTYTATLTRSPCGENPLCSAPTEILGSVTITVSGTDSQFLTTFPVSDASPLTVHFAGNVKSAGYSIDFGDGTTSGDIGCAHGGCPTGGGPTSVDLNHTYSSAGTYTAKLRQHYAVNAGNCAGVDCNVVGTATITVNAARVGSCADDLAAAQADAQARLICGQGGSRMHCPYDSSYVINVLSSCETSFLQSRGWTFDSVSQSSTANIANVLTALEGALKKILELLK